MPPLGKGREPDPPSGRSAASETDSLSAAIEPGGSGPGGTPRGARSDKRIWNRFITIRDEAGQLERFLLGIGCILAVLLVWWLLTRGTGEDRLINPTTLPSPGETFGSFPVLWEDRALSRNVIASLTRVISGFLLAAAIAVPLGIVAGCYPRFDAFAKPLSIFGRNIPVAALIPLTLFWFGIDEQQKILFIFIASVAFIFFDTTQSVRLVPGHFLDTAYTLGARTNWRHGLRQAALFGAGYAVLAFAGSYWIDTLAPAWLQPGGNKVAVTFPGFATWTFAVKAFVAGTLLWLPVHNHQAISKVLFPLALPGIVNSMRLLFGLAFGYIVLAELINAQLGVGHIILMSERRGPQEHIYLVLLVISIVAFAIDRLVMLAQRRAFPYVTDGA